jgi:hypothetical protein
MQDIVAAHPARFNISAFIPKLRDYMRVTHPSKRHFLASVGSSWQQRCRAGTP